jgi:hypothetical protein
MTRSVLKFVQRAVGGRDWQRVLEFADRTQLTLHLDGAEGAPEWFREAVALRMRKNAERLSNLHRAYDEVREALDIARVDFVLLKGFSHSAFGGDPGARVQYDVDILCDNTGPAVPALGAVGYEFYSRDSLSSEHLPPLVKPSEWQWSGDYFDPAMPIPVELHTSLWDADRDRIALPGIAEFWHRRERDTHWLALPDRVAFAALHALRHILRNDAKPAHVLELACFLDRRASDTLFWTQWASLHDDRLRRIQAVAFRFASEWFGCRLPNAVTREIAALPVGVRRWFDQFAWSPLMNLSHPNKDVVWLHFALAETAVDRMVILQRRVFPVHRSRTHGVSTPARAWHHASAIAPVLASGLRWRFRRAASSTADATSA